MEDDRKRILAHWANELARSDAELAQGQTVPVDEVLRELRRELADCEQSMSAQSAASRTR